MRDDGALVEVREDTVLCQGGGEVRSVTLITFDHFDHSGVTSDPLKPNIQDRGGPIKRAIRGT